MNSSVSFGSPISPAAKLSPSKLQRSRGRPLRCAQRGIEARSRVLVTPDADQGEAWNIVVPTYHIFFSKTLDLI